MPGVVASQRKRKEVLSGEPPRKKRRSSSEEGDDMASNTLLLEQGILESKKNYNDITKLLQMAGQFKTGNPESMLGAVALCRIFVRLLAQGSLVLKRSLSEKDATVAGWLKDQLSALKRTLLDMLEDGDHAGPALTLSMRILKAEGEYLYDKEEYAFPKVFLRDIVAIILRLENDEVRKTYIEEFAEQYDDIRYHTFSSIKHIFQNDQHPTALFDAAFDLLSVLDGVPESPEELEDFYVPRPEKKSSPLRSVSQHKRQGQEAWIAVLAVVENKAQQKKTLNMISTVIAPWFTKPELLADFLTSCYDAGGSLSLLALSGVFYLIQERNLDYPSFYPKLYSLLDRDILHSKHRSRFFRLLDTFLGSTHLPAALVASFVKRLSRLSLNAPPSAIVFVVPWIYNLLRRHPTCTFMLHRETSDAEAQQYLQEHGADDPFLPEEADPMETHAIESCLWELVQLQSHYHPNVATIAKIISEQFTKQSYNMEDFLDHSYASLLEAELGKEVKKTPVVEFQIPKRVFLPQDPSTGNPDNLLAKLWDFPESHSAWSESI